MAALDPSRVSGWETHGLISMLVGSTGFLADGLDSQFNLVNDPSEPAVIEMIDEALRPYSFPPESESKITNLE
jgi:hypothetical protein